MSWGEILVKLAPYIFYLASLIFIVIAALHIKALRQKDMEEQIALQEQFTNEKHDNYSPDDVINALNDLEQSSGSVSKKE